MGCSRVVGIERNTQDVPEIGKEGYETRIVILAMGIQGHDEDINSMRESAKTQKPPIQNFERNFEPYFVPAFDYLSDKFDDFEILEDTDEIGQILSELEIDDFTSVDKVGRYTSESQKVKYVIVTVESKQDFKKALEIEEPQLHVIYDGHSRYGRGACFDTYTDVVDPKGEQWESGTGDDDGLFRLGYPYVPVALEDIKHHQYHFTPTAIEEGLPPNEKVAPFSRHPHARGSLRKISLDEKLEEGSDEKLEDLVPASYESPSNQYYGLTVEGKESVLLHAGWTETKSDPYDLGATELKCNVFCHFGCSSKLHYWEIVREQEYKGWNRPKPPTERYAYFTTAPSDARLTPLWLYYLLSYDKENAFNPWFDSLEEAKKKTNNKLRSIGVRFEIY